LKKEFSLISETRHRYETIVRPYIEKYQFNAQWVYNIIDGKSERERILLETDQFIVLPDIMWDGKAKESLHILVLVKSHDIHSIRDLKSEHIPMLESLFEKTSDFIFAHFFIIHRHFIIYIFILRFYKIEHVVVKLNEHILFKM
jgi:m7GpppX diphosphatase